MSFINLMGQKAIGVPGADRGGADGLVLFDSLSKTGTAIVQVTDAPIVLKAYGLTVGQTIAINNFYPGTNVAAPYIWDGNAVVLSPTDNTEVLFLTGYYQLVFSGTPGTVTLTATSLTNPRQPGDGVTAAGLRSEVAFPNPLLGSTNILSSKQQIGPMPWVFRAYGLGDGDVISVLNVYAVNGVDTVEPCIIGGVVQELTATSNTLVLDLAGYYQFQIETPIEGLLLIGHETAAQFIDPYALEQSQAAAAQAAASATAAANSDTDARNQATAAAASASAAAGSAAAAAASATSAANQVTLATTQATSAATSATTATTQAGVSTASATTSATEAGIATTQATAAGVSATASAVSATASAGSATTATTQAGIATTQAGNAVTSATNAATSATAAGTSATAAAASATAAALSASTPSATVVSASGVVTINLAAATKVYFVTLHENVTSWVFSNPPAAGFMAQIDVVVAQAASGGPFTCVSPASSGQTSGGAWTVSATAGKVQWLDLFVNSAGSVKMNPEAILA